MAGYMNAELEAIRLNLICTHCQVSFQGTDSQARKVKYEKAKVYCSSICRSTATSIRLTKPQLTQGPCKTCGKAFSSKRPKTYCSIKCYTSSKQFKDMQAENLAGIRERPTVRSHSKSSSGRPPIPKETIHCRECNKETPKTSKTRAYCSQVCYRAYMAKRFDRHIANPQEISLIQGYDEFLDQDELECIIEGCTWVGKHLSLHINLAHGIQASEVKRAAGFSLSSGIVAKPLAESLRQRELVGVAKNPNTIGLELARLAIKNKPKKYRSKETNEHLLKTRSLMIEGPVRTCLHCGIDFRQSTRFGKTLYCTKECRAAKYAAINQKKPKKKRERQLNGTFKWV